jgi:hypothetical protein
MHVLVLSILLEDVFVLVADPPRLRFRNGLNDWTQIHRE